MHGLKSFLLYGWKYKHISQAVSHILIREPVFQNRTQSQQEEPLMSEQKKPILTVPPRTVASDDLDDLIFREESWLTSDR